MHLCGEELVARTPPQGHHAQRAALGQRAVKEATAVGALEQRVRLCESLPRLELEIVELQARVAILSVAPGDVSIALSQ